MTNLHSGNLKVLDADGVAVAEYDGFSTATGKKFEFVARNEDASVFRLSVTSRKKRKSDAKKMTGILRVRIQMSIDEYATVAEAAQLAGVDSYFDDLAALGGSALWLFAVACDGAKNRTAFAFCRDSRLRRDDNGIAGAGYVLLPGKNEAIFSENMGYRINR